MDFPPRGKSDVAASDSGRPAAMTQQSRRPKISVYTAISMDGLIARKDQRVDWLACVHGFGEDYGFGRFMDSVDALIIGRKTYETAITVADPYPGKKVYVLSHHLDSVRNGMELFRGDIRTLVAQLQSEGVRHIWVDGGVTISQFLRASLVDTITLSVIPVILGDGLPLCSLIGKEIACRLLASQSYPSGLVQMRYEVNVGLLS